MRKDFVGILALLILFGLLQSSDVNAGAPERIEIQAFVDRYAKQEGKDIVIDPRLKGTVSISSELTPGHISHEEFYSALLTHNFGAVENDGAIRIIQNSQLKQHKLPIYDGKNRNGLVASQVVNAILRVNDQRQVSDLASQLRPYVGQWGSVIPDAHSNSLMVVSTVENVEHLIDILDRLDK